MNAYETRAVLAEAKRGMARKHPECDRTHLVTLPHGWTVCRRVKVWNLADRDATDPSAAPTCKDCLRVWDREHHDDAKATITVLEIRPGCGCRLRCAEHRRALAQLAEHERLGCAKGEMARLLQDQAAASHLAGRQSRDDEVAELTAQRDKALADLRSMVELAADQKLAGYRALGERAAAAENERDAYARAKAENDERFMLERDEARAQLEVATKALDEENIRRVGISGELDEARRQRDRWYEHVSELVRAEDAVQRNDSRERPSDELWTAIAQKRAALERARTALRKAGRP